MAMLEKMFTELEAERDEIIYAKKKAEEALEKQKESHEEEVQLRMKFESKLNNLHSMHRDL